jgi:hypothetical protein
LDRLIMQHENSQLDCNEFDRRKNALRKRYRLD